MFFFVPFVEVYAGLSNDYLYPKVPLFPPATPWLLSPPKEEEVEGGHSEYGPDPIVRSPVIRTNESGV